MIPEEANEEEEVKDEEIKGVPQGEPDPETPHVANNSDQSDEDETE